MFINKFRLLFLVFMILGLILGFEKAGAQSRKLPPFRIMQANGKVFNARQLPAGKPIIIIYFSPDCDHCQAMIKDFFKRAGDFKKASVAMITFLPVHAVVKFTNDYKVSSYPNITAGTEETSFFVRNYYKIKEIPFVALHDKDGNLVATYERNVPLNKLVSRLQKLK